MKQITVLLADDNRVVREGFRTILEREDDLEVVGEATNGHQAVALAKKLRPTLVLMVDRPDRGADIVSARLFDQVTHRAGFDRLDDIRFIAVRRKHEHFRGREGFENLPGGFQTIEQRHGHVQGNTFFSPSIPKRLHKRHRIITSQEKKAYLLSILRFSLTHLDIARNRTMLLWLVWT